MLKLTKDWNQSSSIDIHQFQGLMNLFFNLNNEKH